MQRMEVVGCAMVWASCVVAVGVGTARGDTAGVRERRGPENRNGPLDAEVVHPTARLPSRWRRDAVSRDFRGARAFSKRGEFFPTPPTVGTARGGRKGFFGGTAGAD
ncbi:hypothetical protein GCM10023235_19410 [Kitasatospora terrestris]|uniref:Secreted protein n=1 Tax=Kitasatospora terrestris TaxID=258051 RepID=A0ABP9DHB7_9ACTN